MAHDSIFIDTWGWVALGNRSEKHHEEVMKAYKEFRNRRMKVYTSDYVLDELITLLFRREKFSQAVRFTESVFSSAKLGHVIIERITTERFGDAWKLRKKYQDKPGISFTDLTSMVVMTEKGITDVLTDDDHFLQVGLGFTKIP